MPKIIAEEDIYQAVMESIIERGYSGATTKQIAQAAGISEVTLFRKYGSKAELVKQAIINEAEKIDFPSAAQYTGDVSADLLRVVELYQGSTQQHGPFFYTVLLEVPRHPDLTDLLESPFSLVQNVAQLVARYQGEGTLQDEHPLHAVAALLGPLMITNMIRQTGPSLPFPPLDLEVLVRNFLDGRRQD